MPTCKKCKAHFPTKTWIDGKRRNLGKRSFCLKCSPFGSHNTRDLCGRNLGSERKCRECGKNIPAKQKCGTRCHTCWMHVAQQRRSDRLYGIVGDSCWICGYDKGRYMLDFHHMDPKTKCFSLDLRSLVGFTWERVLAEAEKCLLVCCRCHREIENPGGSLIPEDLLRETYIKQWELCRGSQAVKAAVS
jgi:hypothetical protein